MLLEMYSNILQKFNQNIRTESFNIVNFIASQDHRTFWFASGRSLLAFAQLTFLLTTPFISFIVPVGANTSAKCDGVRSVSLLCIYGGDNYLDQKRWILIFILTIVLVGIYPRYTGIFHVWATFSMSTSFTLPDGGDAIAFIVSVFILPLCLIDSRVNHWSRPKDKYSISFSAVCAGTSIATRFQIAFIYLHSAIAKMGVEEWANGAAEYYIVRDLGFGISAPFKKFVLSFTDNPWGTLTLSWSAIIFGIVIAVCILLGKKARIFGFYLDLVFHFAIIVMIGLWSFALTMIAAAAIAVNSNMPYYRSKESEFFDIEE